MTAEYLVGRSEDALTVDKVVYVDSLFAAGRYEGVRYRDLDIQHSTFANNSLKDSVFEKCTFKNVAFVGVYFRDAMFKECRFSAAT